MDFAMKNRTLLFTALLCSCASRGQTPPTLVTEERGASLESPVEIREADLRRHVELLASDELEGRATLSPGYERAARYIAEEFARYGLEVLPGRADYQVPYRLWQEGFESEKSTLVFRTAGGELAAELGVDAAPFSFSEVGEKQGEIVFAGYGISAPELGHDDYAGLEVEGKWVLVLRHGPGYKDEASPFFGGVRKGPTSAGAVDGRSHLTFRRKAQTAQKHGALGMLLVSGPLTVERPDDLRLPKRLWVPRDAAENALAERRKAEAAASRKKAARAAKSGKKSRKKSGKKSVGPKRTEAEASSPFLSFHISPKLAQALLPGQWPSLRAVQEQLERGVPGEIVLESSARAALVAQDSPRLVEGMNVIGYLEGSDPLLKRELVVVGGHFDHLGRFGAPGASGDTTFNGADDNASGTAGVLELAQAFAGPGRAGRRSMLFIGFSGEEKGLLGSRAMLKQGLVDPASIVFMLNLDMIGRNGDEPVEFVGHGSATRIMDILRDARADIDLEVELGSYAGNSDHHPFYERDIPVAFFFTGLHEDYHGLGDHADKLDYERMQRIVKLGEKMVGRVANDEEKPEFVHDLLWLGASIVDQRSKNASVISAVTENSRASRAGLLSGDRIHSLDGVTVNDGRGQDSLGRSITVGRQLAQLDPGTAFAMVVERDGQYLEVELERSRRGYLGIYPAGLSEDDRARHRLADDEGLLVSRAVEGGPAHVSGLRVGDILTRVAGSKVDARSLGRVLSRIGAGEVVQVEVVRDGSRLQLSLKLGEPPTRG